MKLYADRPVRACLQLISDLAALIWIFAWVSAALSLREVITSLNRPGELMVSAGDGVTEHMGSAAEQAERVPVAGEALASPFLSVGEAGESLSSAGTSFQESVATLALVLPLLTAVLPLLLLGATWLPLRLRWIRRARQTLLLDSLDPDARERLLALRALTSAPSSALIAVHRDPAAAWHSDDRAVVRDLAAVELRRLALRERTPAEEPAAS